MKSKNKILQLCLTVLLLMLVLVFFMAYGLYYFEKDEQPQMFGSFFDALYFIFLNLTTVGYSDMGPMTSGGKLIFLATTAIGTIIGVVFLVGIVLGSIKLYKFIEKV